MATEKQVAGSGQGLTWGNAFSATTLNSLGAARSILSDVAIDNSSALDLYADVCVEFSTAQAWSSTPYAYLYLYPLNQDGTTYGDGQFATAGSNNPATQYYAGLFYFVQTASGTQVGTVAGILLPPGKFKFVFTNSGADALPSSNCNCYYRTYNRSVV